MLRRALQIDEASYGAHHPEVGDDLDVLAGFPQHANRPGEAVPLLRRALAIYLAFQRDNQEALALNWLKCQEAQPPEKL